MKKGKQNIFFIFLTLFNLLICGISYSQTDPAPFYLPGGNYSFITWINTMNAATYPPVIAGNAGNPAATCNAIWHRCSTINPILTDPITGDYTGTYNGGAAAYIQGLGGTNGFAFYNQNSASVDNNLGAFVVGLNSVGRTNIIVIFSARGISAGVAFGVRLQYRLSTVGTWIDVPGPVEYLATNVTPPHYDFTANLSTLTGNAVDNLANFQVRWKYYDNEVAHSNATGTKIQIDSVYINSTAIAASNYLCTAGIKNAPFCVSPSVGKAVSVPFGYTPAATFTSGTCVFTAQLSNAAGSFAAPTVIGSIVSNGSGYQTIAATIPANTPSGNNYRIRVISSAPVMNGNDNGVDIPIYLSPVNVSALAANCGDGTSTVSWTNPVNYCYDEIMVVACPNVPNPGTPSGNGSAYTANSLYGSGSVLGGSGFVVYKGTGTSVAITGLADGTNYYFKVWVRYGSEWSSGQEVNCTPDYTLKVVVNEYLNAASPLNEWTELLVTGDNVDMRKWKIRDNNSTQTNWQVEVNFNNIPFWQHMRRGTVIMLWHRDNFHPVDSNKADGYIELNIFDAAHFNGSSAGSSTMDLANSGDIVELLDSSFTHVHALGHQATPGVSWTSMASPKLNHQLSSSLADPEAVYVCPGGQISDYDGPSGTLLTSRNSVTLTQGLPNTCASNPLNNTNFWNSLRQPYFNSQTVAFSSVTPGSPGSVTFTWLAATDPYPADNTMGYIVLRNTTNSFPQTPADGTTYTLGASIGGATVVGILTGSGSTTFTDNTVMNGNTYYYRVFAYRYGIDDENGNTWNPSRGTAYNETNFVTVNWPTPLSALPVELLFFKGDRQQDEIHLTWATSSEKNNDHFIIEKSSDGVHFTLLGTVKGFGNSTDRHDYSLDDLNPALGINYYALSQIDFDGKISERKIIAVKFNGSISLAFNLFPNPFTDVIQVDCSSLQSGEINLTLFDCVGKQVYIQKRELSNGYNHFTLDASYLEAGTYFLKAESNNETYNFRVVKK